MSSAIQLGNDIVSRRRARRNSGAKVSQPARVWMTEPDYLDLINKYKVVEDRAMKTQKALAVTRRLR